MIQNIVILVMTNSILCSSLVCPALSKEERELVRRKALKQIRVKYGLQVSLL